MVFIKKVINADAGTADLVGGDQWDILDDYHDNVDITPKVGKVNTRTYFRSGKRELRNPADTFSYIETASAIAADRTVTEPLLTGNDVRVYEAHAATLTNKTMSGASNTFTNLGTATLSDNSVTFAKMQDIATDRIIGRDTAATGDPEELTIGGGLEFTGTGGVQTSAFTGDVTKAAGGTATTIADDVVTNTKAANMAANTVKANTTGSTADPSDLAVGASTVVGRGAAGNVVAAAIETSQIANDAVTYAKMQNVSAASKLLGRGDSGSGDTQEITLGTNLSITGTTINASGGGGGAPTGAQYVTLATDATLTAERVATAGDGITLTDAGAGNNLTFDFDYIDLARKRVGFIEDFFGIDGTSENPMSSNVSGTGSDVAQVNVNETGVFGVWRLETGTTATGFANVSTGSPAPLPIFLLGQGVTTVEGKIQIPTLSDGTNTFKVVFGLRDDVDSASITDAVYFEYIHSSSANWRFCTSDDTVRTENNSSTVVNAGQWYSLKIVVNAAASSVEFFVDGSSIGTITTNIPTATTDSLSVNLSITKTVGTTERTLLVDYIAFQIDLTTLR